MSVDSDDAALMLPAEMTIKHAKDLQSSLMSVIDDDGPITIDAGAVSSVDTSALQLLVAFVNTQIARNNVVVLRSVSDELRLQVQRLGLTRLLDLDSETAETAAPTDDELCPVF